MEGNDVYLGQPRECMLGDPSCEEHYDFAGPGLANIGLADNRLDICWHDSWYDEEYNRMEGPSWIITLKRRIYWSKEEISVSPEDWRSISETRWAMFVGPEEQAIQEAVRRYRLVVGNDLNVIKLDQRLES